MATSARSDLLGSVAWMAIGVAVVGGALAMDRLEAFGATLYTAPGLVPGLLGALLCGLGVVLFVRSLRAGALVELRTGVTVGDEARAGRKRVVVALALILVYLLGLVGRLPFAVATFAFVASFMLVFHGRSGGASTLARRLAIAVAVALVTAASVTLLFEQVFLVRLP